MTVIHASTKATVLVPASLAARATEITASNGGMVIIYPDDWQPAVVQQLAIVTIV